MGMMDYQLLFGKSLLVALLGLRSGTSTCQTKTLLTLSLISAFWSNVS